MTPQMLKGGALPGLCAVAVVILSLAAGAEVAKETAKNATAPACTVPRQP